MKRKLRTLSLFLACALLLPLAGCDAAPAASSTPLTDGIQALSVQTSYDGAADDALQGCREFSVRLFAESVKSAPGQNVLLSPLSVFLALGMASNGAQGETREQFASLLGGDPEELNPAMTALLQSLMDTGGSTKLALANSIWTRKQDFTPRQQFLEQMAAYFGSEFFTVDMGPRQTTDQVNDWISRKTEGLIPHMLEEISPETVMLLINALYLDSRWETPFDPNSTYPQDFTQADGTARKMDFMNSGPASQELYLQGETFDGVLLPYDDGALGFVALRPTEGSAGDLAQALTADTLKNLLDGAETRPMALSLPKFQTAYDCELRDLLQSMGLTDAFSTLDANFTGLGVAPNNIYLSRVAHKTVLEVAEEGTKAAAATVVEAEAGAAIPPDDFVIMVLDHPFLYGVVDLKSGTPLFLGVLNTAEGAAE